VRLTIHTTRQAEAVTVGQLVDCEGGPMLVDETRDKAEGDTRMVSLLGNPPGVESKRRIHLRLRPDEWVRLLPDDDATVAVWRALRAAVSLAERTFQQEHDTGTGVQEGAPWAATGSERVPLIEVRHSGVAYTIEAKPDAEPNDAEPGEKSASADAE
jgi:hypothetical protein